MKITPLIPGQNGILTMDIFGIMMYENNAIALFLLELVVLPMDIMQFGNL